MPPSSFLQVLAVVLFVLLAVEWTKRFSPTPVCVCTFPNNSATAPPLRSVPVGFSDIFREKGTDKLHRHGYHRFYDPLMSALQHAPLTLLEVGADHGASMNSWSAYFSHSSAKFYGLSYGVNPSTHSDTRVTIISGDQSSCTDLQGLVSRIATKIDVIIDDGSHHPHHQLRSFLYLFPYLPPGGIYVIEDVETSYWDKPGASVYGYPLPGVGTGSTTSIVEFAKLLVEVINQRYMVTPDSYKRDFALFTPKVDPDVESVMFAQNIIVFRKKAVVEYDRVLDNLADGHSFQAFLRSSRVGEMLATARQLLCH